MSTSTITPPATNEHGVTVGDFFVSSWGYDQTNIDFYKVIAVTPKGVKVQKWRKASMGNPQAPQVGVVPGSGPVVGVRVRVPQGWSEYDPNAVAPIEFHRLKTYGPGRVAFRVASYANAYQWDGQPEYQTGSGWGH